MDDPLEIVYYWQEKGAYRNLIDVIGTFPPHSSKDIAAVGPFISFRPHHSVIK